MRQRLLTTLIALVAIVMSAGAEDYGVMIGDQALTATTTTTYTRNNLSFIQSGSVTYNPSTNTLTLKSVKIHVPSGRVEGAILFSKSGTLVLTGTNIITATENGIEVAANLTINGGGSLTCNSSINCGIYVKNGATLTIGGCTVTAEGYWGIAGNKTNERLLINNANVSAKGNDDGSICDFNYTNNSAYWEKAIELTDATIASPEGAKLNTATNMAVVNASGNVIVGETVVIHRDYTDNSTGLVYGFKQMNGTIKAMVKGHTGALQTDLVIPSQITVDGAQLEVGAIGVGALQNCSNLNSVTIPETVTEIGGGAFYNCTKLASVIVLNPIPMSIHATTFNLSSQPNNSTYEKTLIVPLGSGGRYRAANYWKQFQTIMAYSEIDGGLYMENESGGATLAQCKTTATAFTIPASVTSGGTSFPVTEIAQMTFSDFSCPNIESISIPASVKIISAIAIANCPKLTSITIASGNTVYDSRESCNAIIQTATNTLILGCPTTVIPATVTIIGEGAFSMYGDALTSITIPSSVTQIGNYAFAQCNLTEIMVKTKVPPTLGTQVFDDNVYTTATLKVPTPEAYQQDTDWKKFTNIVSGAKVTYGDFVFSLDDETHEAELTAYNGTAVNVVIPSNVTDAGVSYSVTSIGPLVFLGNYYHFNETMKSVLIPTTVKTITAQAFAGCTALTSITIPASVKSIGEAPFILCDALTSIKVVSGNTVYDSRANCNAIIEKATNTLVHGIVTTVIPSTVTAIGDKAFYYQQNLTSIVIPNNVKTIGDCAFQYCYSLANVTLPDGLEHIGNYVFDDCQALESINIPFSLKSIGMAFLNSGLKSVVIPNNITTLDDYAFDRCDELTSVTLPGSMKSIGTRAFRYCYKLRNIEILTAIPPTMGTEVFGVAYNDENEWEDEFGIYSEATLHVPEGSITAYQTADVWKYFQHFDGLSLPKCATPTITFANGKLTYECQTEGVEFVTNVSVAGNGQFKGSQVPLSNLKPTYTISVYAMKDGYLNSDFVTTEVEFTPSTSNGDINGDGQINITDVTTLVNIILGRQ